MGRSGRKVPCRTANLLITDHQVGLKPESHITFMIQEDSVDQKRNVRKVSPKQP